MIRLTLLQFLTISEILKFGLISKRTKLLVDPQNDNVKYRHFMFILII